MRRALVVGTGGLLGSALAEVLGPEGAAGTWARRPLAGAARLDLAEVARDPAAAVNLIDGCDPWAVFLAGGTSSAEACEADEAAAMAGHFAGPAALAGACARVGVPLVLFSPDIVFDGAAGPYAEDAEPAPMAALGRAKRLGEKAVLKASSGNLVIRSSWVFGPEPRGEGVAYRIARALKEGRSVPVAADQYSTPTYSRDLAAAAVALAAEGHSGIVHVAGPETMNAASFAMLVAERAGVPSSLVKPVPAATLGMAALRPPWGGLACGRLRTFLPRFSMRPPGAAMDHWKRNQRGVLWPF